MNRNGMANPNFRHGEAGRTAEYRAWGNIKTRCFNQANANYPYYGGRGITMHAPWRKDFQRFLADVEREIGRRPSLVHTIDRTDVDGNYEPGNIRWATRAEQSQNLRRNVKLTLGAETKPLSEWADQFGIPYHTLYGRIFSYRLPVEIALTKTEAELRAMHPRPSVYHFTLNGETKSLHEWAAAVGMSYRTLYGRIFVYGHSFPNALTKSRKELRRCA